MTARTSGQATQRRQRRAWVPATVAAAASVIGVLDVVSALAEAVRTRIHELPVVVPGLVTGTTTAAVVLVGLLLVALAHALRRRKRRAWRAAVLLLGVSVVLRVGRGLVPLTVAAPRLELAEFRHAVLAVTLLGVLLAQHREFYAEGDPRTRWRAPAAFAAMAVGDVLVGLLWLFLVRHRLTAGLSFSEAIQDVLRGLVGISGPAVFRSDRMGDVSYGLLLTLGALTAVIFAYLLLRPAEPAPARTEEDDRRVRALLAGPGRQDSLGYFALRWDKSVIWSPSGKAGIAYRVLSGVILASGDPLGDPEAWPGAVRRFLHHAARHAWVPAVLGCGERAGEVWVREAGLAAFELGDEAVVSVDGFTLEGRAMRGVRQAVARLDRQGYCAEVTRAGDLGAEQRAQLRLDAARWRHGQVERGFSMSLGRVAELDDPDCVLVTARHGDRLHSFLQLTPWGGDGLSLDVMRRDPAEAATGVNEFMIAHLIDAAPRLGVRRVSLNFAVFRATLARGERLGAGPVVRWLRRVLRILSRWFQIESLYRFNARFLPAWLPRYLLYPAARDLPRVLWAALRAEAFIAWPHAVRRHGDRAAAGPPVEMRDGGRPRASYPTGRAWSERDGTPGR